MTPEKFLSKTCVGAKTGCREWTASICRLGYGSLGIRGKSWKAHRYSWTLFKGEIPHGLHVLHRCDNRRCVNPEHLFLGTHQENMQDMVKKNRHVSPLGERHGRCRFSDEDVRRIREAALFGAKQTDLAAAYGCRQGTISNIVRRIGRLAA
jgi:hypothetical protein